MPGSNRHRQRRLQSSLPAHPTPPTTTRRLRHRAHRGSLRQCKPTATPPPNTTIAIVTVGVTTSATIGVEADAVDSGVPHAATLGIRPTLARIARNLRAASRTPKLQKTAVSGTSDTRDTVGSGFATRWKSRMCPGTNLLPTWVGTLVRATVTDDPPHTSTIPSKQQFSLAPKLPQPTPIPSSFKHKAQRKALERQARRLRLLNEATLLDRHISWAEGERTTKAKADTTSKQRRAIDHGPHDASQETTPTLSRTGDGNSDTPRLEQPIHYQTCPPRPPTNPAPTQKPPPAHHL
eukprot:CCRYP_009165-RA/>CCRYP_009165-RA protein AED:0.58 eAED:0.40 QI:0/0/0/1/1/1/2/0/292